VAFPRLLESLTLAYGTDRREVLCVDHACDIDSDGLGCCVTEQLYIDGVPFEANAVDACAKCLCWIISG